MLNYRNEKASKRETTIFFLLLIHARAGICEEIHSLIQSNLIKTIVLVNFFSLSLLEKTTVIIGCESARKIRKGWRGRKKGSGEGERDRGSTKIIELKLYTNCFMNMILSHTKRE